MPFKYFLSCTFSYSHSTGSMHNVSALSVCVSPACLCVCVGWVAVQVIQEEHPKPLFILSLSYELQPSQVAVSSW